MSPRASSRLSECPPLIGPSSNLPPSNAVLCCVQFVYVCVCGGDDSLAEAVEALEREPPRSTTHTMSVGCDIGAEVLAAEAFVVEEGHFVWLGGVVCEVCVFLSD